MFVVGKIDHSPDVFGEFGPNIAATLFPTISHTDNEIEFL